MILITNTYYFFYLPVQLPYCLRLSLLEHTASPAAIEPTASMPMESLLGQPTGQPTGQPVKTGMPMPAGLLCIPTRTDLS